MPDPRVIFRVEVEDVAAGTRETYDFSNLITDEGLSAWGYNLANTTTDALGQIHFGTDNTAPAAADTALGAQVYTSKTVSVRQESDQIVAFHTLQTGEANGNTLREVGLSTLSGAFFCRALLPKAVAKASTIRLHTSYRLALTKEYESGTSGATWTPYDWLLRWAAARIMDPDRYDPVGYVAFGAGTAGTVDLATESLFSEVYREAVTPVVSGGKVTLSGFVAASEYAGTLREAGPAVGATTDQGVLSRFSGFEIDNTSGQTNYTFIIWGKRPASPEPTLLRIGSAYGYLLGSNTTHYHAPLNSVEERTAYIQAFLPVKTAGVLRNLYLIVGTAPGAGESLTFTVYKNGSITSLAVTISDTDTTGTNTSDELSVAAGDTFSLQVTSSASAASLQHIGGCLEYLPAA